MPFPPNPNPGDLYTTSLGTRYQYNVSTTSWDIVSQEITGATGLQGFQGDTGVQGFTGIT